MKKNNYKIEIEINCKADEKILPLNKESIYNQP